MKSRFILLGSLLSIFIVSFIFRFYGLLRNDPFWSDEFFTASQGKLIFHHWFNIFLDPGVHLEYHNITTHFLVAIFFKLFGFHEWVARFPLVIVGSIVPVMVFIFARRFFNLTTAISATFLTVFSYIEIVWSRQARGYPLQQFFVLLIFYLYLISFNEKRKILTTAKWVFLIISVFLGILTHVFFYIVGLSLIIHFALFKRSHFLSLLKKPWIYLVLLISAAVAYETGFFRTLLYFFSSNSFGTNNLWYYHPFLWREYGLVTFLALSGLLVAVKSKNRATPLILIYTFMHLFFISFIIKPYVSRYLIIIFPFLFIFMGYAITNIGQVIRLPIFKKNIFITVLLTLFIIANGFKFVNRPKSFYSVNHDFREIALIDYHSVYKLIKEKIETSEIKPAIIETNTERATWYLEPDYKPIYLFRWTDEKGFVNGLAKKTAYQFNSEGERIVADTKLRLVGNLSDLKKVIKKYPNGFIYIDDASLPKDVIDFAQKNFKKELYLDHYPLDDNPYSIWPATLYSWGI